MHLLPLLFITFVLLPVFNAHAADSCPSEYLEQSNKALSRFTLDNGMIALIKEDHTAPLVSIQIWVGTGSIHEQNYLGAGLSHAIEHMIFKGTTTRKPAEIAKTIDDAGGAINAYTSLDRTVFYVDIPAKYWQTGLDVLADAIMNPAFPEEEWKKEKEVIMREMAMNNDMPERQLSRLLLRTAYRIHPYRVPVIGHEELFKKIKRADLETLFHSRYTPDNMIIAIAGDIDLTQCKAVLKKTFSGFERRARCPVVLPKEPPQIAARSSHKTGAYEVTRLEWTYHTVPVSSPDAIALDMLAAITGQGRSSRLVQEIQETKQLTHSIGAWSFTPMYPGLFGINATYDRKNEELLIKAIKSEISRWRSTPFTTEEVDKARKLLTTSILLEYQTMHGQAQSLAEGEFYAGDARYSEKILRQLAAITPEAITEAARKYLREENRTLAILSPKAGRKEKDISKSAIITSEIQKRVLPNGIPVIIKEDHRLPFVHLCIAAGGGLLLENKANNGITKLMSELLIRGTTRHSSKEIATLVDSLGGNLTAFSGRNSVGLCAQCFSKDAEKFMNLLSDCVINPAFDNQEMIKRKAIQTAQIATEQESPFFLAHQMLKTMLFPGHPYCFSATGTSESVESITADDIKSYYKKTVVTENVVISVFGDIVPEKAFKLVEKAFRDFPRGIKPALEFEISAPNLPAVLEQSAPRNQTIILTGFPGITFKDQRMETLRVLCNILNGLSSNLLIAIRDKEGLAYYTGAFNLPGVDTGSFVIYAGTHKQALEKVKELIGQEITRLRTEGIHKAEFNRAIEQIKAQAQKKMQLNARMAMDCALNELYGLGFQYDFLLEERLKTITIADINQAAASILMPEKQATAIILPESNIE